MEMYFRASLKALLQFHLSARPTFQPRGGRATEILDNRE